MKKKLAMIAITCMTLSMSIGCNAFGAEATEENNIKAEKVMEKHKELDQKGNMAKVVEINENSLVVKLAERPELPEGEDGERPARPENEDGERPPRPEGKDGEMPPTPPEGEDGEMPPAPPEGEDGEMPPTPSEGEDGEMPSKPRHGGRMMGEMTFSEEEIEIVLDDSITIDLGKDIKGSIEDIAVDDIVMIIYEEDGETIKNISVRNEDRPKEDKPFVENTENN